ncbi:hypothetical protein ABZ705_24670 [Streptomyces sp. NPDC006984]|uniref:hypothetical protein n=1 Tax=unclassified Streptomyces TaxID=2593676 RepID=UPI0033F9630F
MFRRTFWFTAGAAAGVWATTKVNRKLRQLTPESLAAQAADKAIDAGHRLKGIAVDIRAQMVQREAELGEALGLDDHPDRVLPPARPRPAVGPARRGASASLPGGPRGRYDIHRTDTQNTTEDRTPGTSNNGNEDH